MATEIATLQPEHRDELIAFIDKAFNKHNERSFNVTAPRLVTPEMMACYPSIRQDGRIVATAGVFPIDWQVGSEVLRIAGIGNVACDPACRGQGLMSKLMTAIADNISERGYDASVLGGQRQRYRYFGWERTGVKIEFLFTAASVRHDMKDLPDVTIRPFDLADQSLLDAAKKLHDSQAVRAIRPADGYADYLTHWDSTPYAALDSSGKLLGYIVTNKSENYGVELFADSPDVACAIVARFMDKAADRGEGDFKVFTGPENTPMFRRFIEASEVWTLVNCGNWNFADNWPRVAEVLLRHRHSQSPLVHGEARIATSENASQVHTFKVDSSGVSHAFGPGEADLVIPNAAVPRVLFGSLSSIAQAGELTAGRVPPSLATLDAWCPLPLYLPKQDLV